MSTNEQHLDAIRVAFVHYVEHLAFAHYMNHLAMARYGRAIDASFGLDAEAGFAAYEAAELALTADQECTRALERTLSPQTMLAIMAMAIEGGTV